MDKDHKMKNVRLFSVTANKYQEQMVLLAFLPSALMFLAFVCVVFVGNPALCMFVFHTTFLGPKQSSYFLSEIIIFIMCFFFIFSLAAAFYISCNMVGAFGRIIREMDEIIAGRSQKLIISRPNDTLSKDLLKRINVFIEYYLKHEKKNP